MIAPRCHCQHGSRALWIPRPSGGKRCGRTAKRTAWGCGSLAEEGRVWSVRACSPLRCALGSNELTGYYLACGSESAMHLLLTAPRNGLTMAIPLAGLRVPVLKNLSSSPAPGSLFSTARLASVLEGLTIGGAGRSTSLGPMYVWPGPKSSHCDGVGWTPSLWGRLNVHWSRVSWWVSCALGSRSRSNGPLTAVGLP